jgi:sucrose-6-phosphate hydrolase SacC (GH32 family)
LAELALVLDRLPDTGAVTVRLHHGTSGETAITADLTAQELRLDRTRSGRSDFHPRFAGVQTAPLRTVDGRLNLHLIVDVSSVELFAQNGEVAITDLVLPESPGLRVTLETSSPARQARVRSLSLHPLESAPPIPLLSKP